MMVAEAGLEFGLMLSNRGPVVGYATPRELVELGVAAERSGAFEVRFVFTGDTIAVAELVADARGELARVDGGDARVLRQQ